MEKERYLYLDLLRGITMLLVIYSHLNVFCGKNLAITPFNTFCIHFRMPMFFLVSGFLAYSANYNFSLLRKRVLNRVVRQLWPTLLVLIPAAYLFGKGYHHTLYTTDKLGYWFTLALFEVFCLFGVLSWIGHFGGKKLLTIIYVCAIAVCMVAIVYLTDNWDKEWKRPWVQLCSLQITLGRMPYFFYGALLRIYFKEVTTYVFRPAVMCGILLIYIAIIYLHPKLYTLSATPLLLLLIIYPFYLGGNRLALTTIGKGLSYFGRNTLQIYLLHYFIVFTLRDTHIIDPIVRYAVTHWYIELPVLFAISVVIATCCMLLDRILAIARIKPFIFPSKVALPHRRPR